MIHCYILFMPHYSSSDLDVHMQNHITPETCNLIPNQSQILPDCRDIKSTLFSLTYFVSCICLDQGALYKTSYLKYVYIRISGFTLQLLILGHKSKIRVGFNAVFKCGCITSCTNCLKLISQTGLHRPQDFSHYSSQSGQTGASERTA